MNISLRHLVCLLMVVLCMAVFYGCSNTPKQKPAETVLAHKPYFIASILPSSFTYPKDEKKVSLRKNDHSFIEFSADFILMKMGFDDGSEIQIVDFVVTKCSIKDNNINATVQRIYKGNILRYAVSSNANFIFLKTLTTFTLNAVTENGYEQIKVERNVQVLKYHRTSPSYIGGP